MNDLHCLELFANKPEIVESGYKEKKKRVRNSILQMLNKIGVLRRLCYIHRKTLVLEPL